MRPDGTRPARTLEWIARLPLCGEPELAGLLGADPIDVRHLVHELATRGWVESMVPGSPELELRRLSLVRDEAVPALAAALDLAPADVPRRAPVRLKDVLNRVSRVEITAGVNGFLANLASSLRRSGIAELVDARSLPLAAPVGERWWLPTIEGYGCLRAGNLWAPFLVAWDRAGASDLYRRRRVAAWSTALATTARDWSADGLPPILVVCPSLRELRVWEQALLRRTDNGAPDQIEGLLTTRDELKAHGPCGGVWRTPDADRAVSLVERLGWGEAPALLPLELPDELDGLPEQPTRNAPPIREWASRQVTANASAQLWQQVAVLALATGADEQRLMEWVARHPLVSAAELSALLNESEPLIERRLDWLARCGAVRRVCDLRRHGKAKGTIE
jgi:hypothetical protein